MVATLGIVRRGQLLKAFTLIEVLVVVSIIALLVAILMPSLAKARAMGRNAQCLSNTHQFAIAVQTYAAESKDMIPRGGSPDDMHWTALIARMLGDKTKYTDCNQLPVDKRPMYWCPERERFQTTPFVGYVSNQMRPEGPKYLTNPAITDASASWDPEPFISLGAYKIASDVVFLADAEREGKTKEGTASTMCVDNMRKMWRGEVSGIPPKIQGVDGTDVWAGEHLPENASNPEGTNIIGMRRAARRLHLDAFTNCAFYDGHSAGVRACPPAWGTSLVTDPLLLLTDQQRKYAYWLNFFGVTKMGTDMGALPKLSLSKPAYARVAKLPKGTPVGQP